MLKAPPINPRAWHSWHYIVIVGLIMTISVRSFQNPRFTTLGALKIRSTQVGPRFVRPKYWVYVEVG